MFKYALSLVLRRKLRTVLTSLGITIAVFLISFIVFGMQDLQKVLVDQFNRVLKPNEVIVAKESPFSMFGTTSTYDQKEEKEVIMDDNVVKKINDLKYVEKISRMTVLMGQQITLDDKKVPYPQAMMAGWEASPESSYFTEFIGDVESQEDGLLWVSTSFAKFYKEDPESLIGRSVTLEPSASSLISNKSKSIIGKKFTFKISGVFNPGQDKNDAVLTINDSIKVLSSLGGFTDSADYIEHIGYDDLYVTVNSEKVKEFKKYVQDEFHYQTFTADDILSILGSITQGLTIALVMFGLVSGLVAGIGIINTMIMSIYEQTKEIGIIKAIGASNSQVLSIFLIQSGFIGMFGGVMGLALIFLIMKATDSLVVEQLKNAGFTTTSFFNFDIKIALGITIASILVGIISGIYPATRAAKLDPIKALRYE